ncbi:MAG: alpha/beta hydrolase [Clostridia bacterium]|nr:alpha/beta hydrolase [Clostridia bacterium]
MSAAVIIAAILLVFAIAWLAAGYLLIRLTLVRNAAQSHDPQPKEGECELFYNNAISGKEYIATLPQEECFIRSHDGLRLRAVLLPAPQKTDKTMLCLHGYRASGSYDMGVFVRFFASLGYNLLIPDDRAHGASEGKYIGFGNLDSLDCIAWCNYLVGRYGEDCSIVMFGLSMGAASVIAASGDDSLPPQVKGVVGDCGFSCGYDELRCIVRYTYGALALPFVPAASLMMRIFAGYSLRERAAQDMVKNTEIPLLVIHGKEDSYVPTWMGRRIYDNASCDKRLLLIEGATHAHCYLTDKESYEQAFCDLLRRANF